MADQDLDEKREFEERKMKLLLKTTSMIFEDTICNYLENAKWSTMEELDSWIDERLHEYDSMRDQIKEYYNDRIYS